MRFANDAEAMGEKCRKCRGWEDRSKETVKAKSKSLPQMLSPGKGDGIGTECWAQRPGLCPVLR